MKKMQIAVIGYVQNDWNEATPFEAEMVKKCVSKIILKKNTPRDFIKLKSLAS
jgi:hypothetical protein